MKLKALSESIEESPLWLSHRESDRNGSLNADEIKLWEEKSRQVYD